MSTALNHRELTTVKDCNYVFFPRIVGKHSTSPLTMRLKQTHITVYAAHAKLRFALSNIPLQMSLQNYQLQRQVTVDSLISKHTHLAEYVKLERVRLESFSEPSGFTD